jgi:hypothetical protein
MERERVPPHATRSGLEDALCKEMERQGVRHEHRSLHFRVRVPSSEDVPYEPVIVARRGTILFLVEPLVDPKKDRRRVEVLSKFLDQHSPEIVLIAVTPATEISTLPPTAYDEVYADTQIREIASRIREQNPEGIIRPFPKPGRGTSSEEGLHHP